MFSNALHKHVVTFDIRSKTYRALYFLLPVLICGPGFGADATVEQRLAKLEAQVRQLQAENQQLRARLGLESAAPEAATPRAAAKTDATAAGPERQLRIGGILQIQAEAGGATDTRYTDNNDRIFLRRARLTASGRFAEHLDFRTQIEMTGAIGGASALRAQLTDGYITWTPSTRFNIRSGQFKTPFGFEQLYPDPSLFTPERTLGSDRLTLGRQIGVSAFGTLAERFTYVVGAFNGNGINTTANDNDRFLYVGRASGTLWKGKIGSTAAQVNAGVNGFTSNDTSLTMPAEFGFRSNSFTGDRVGIGADAQGALGPLEIWTEWLRDRFDPQSRAPFASFDARMASILGVYKVEKLEFVARYDTYDPDRRSRSMLSTKTWDAGVNYLIHGHDLKLQLHLIRGETGDVAHDRLIARLQTVF